MAPRLIPTSPPFASDAERRVWAALKATLPADALLAANVHLHTHEDLYEADLVVGVPGCGVAVIEVKGGYVERTDDGLRQATPDGMRPIDPVGQADRAKRLLDRYVRGRGWRHGPLRFEHLVALPDVDVGDEALGPDLPRWATLARGDLADAGEQVFRALNTRRSDVRAPTAAHIAELGDLLGGRPDGHAAMAGVAAARDAYVDQLTDAQAQVLQLLRHNPRIVVTGGPGIGKTWLALAQARAWADAGRRVQLLCYSRGLAGWLRAAVGDTERVDVATFDDYAVRTGIDVPGDADQRWWDEVVPDLLRERITRGDFDALVVDEAQDFADSWWRPLLAVFAGEQLLFVAKDDQQTVFAGRGGAVPVDATTVILDENLRNTTQIASVFGPLEASPMRYRGGEGPPVLYVPCPTEQAHAAADREVQRLVDAGYADGRIALLTTYHRHDYHRAAQERRGKDFHWEGYWSGDETFYSTVMGFKGLERPVVVLAVDGFHDGVGRDVMYTGLSRARGRAMAHHQASSTGDCAGDDVR